MSAPEAYPLSWPHGWTRTAAAARKAGQFKSVSTQPGQSWRSARYITIYAAMRRVTDELDRLGAKGVLVSSNLARNKDGSPRSEQRRVEDPGVAVYFSVKGQPRVLACDRYTEPAQNIAAIAAHVDALRTMLRHGVGTADQAFAGYSALPPPKGSAPAHRPWRDVFGPEWVEPIMAMADAKKRTTVLDAAYRVLAKEAHPDNGGSVERMAELNAAVDEARREIANAS